MNIKCMLIYLINIGKSLDLDKIHNKVNQQVFCVNKIIFTYEENTV
jgi:hypothetical protein